MAIYPTKALRTPGGASLALAQAIGLGDLDRAASCFARDACFITPDATSLNGREAIRSILAQLIAAEVKIEIEASSVLLAGEVAFGSERWRIRFRGVDGDSFQQTSPASMVLRHLEDRWIVAIAAPWGWGIGGSWLKPDPTTKA